MIFRKKENEQVFLGIFRFSGYLWLIAVSLWGISQTSAALIQASAFADDTAHVDQPLTSGIATAYAAFETRIGSAVADPIQGKLRAYAVCDQDWRVASAGALVRDSVTYHGPAATLEFRLTVDGSYFIGDRFSKSFYGASVGYGNGKAVWIEDIDGGATGVDAFTLVGYRWTTDGETFPLDYSLSVSVKDQGLADFGSTATLTFVLPTGGYVLSDAGYDSRSIPEPASLGLLAMGLTSLTLRRR